MAYPHPIHLIHRVDALQPRQIHYAEEASRLLYSCHCCRSTCLSIVTTLLSASRADHKNIQQVVKQELQRCDNKSTSSCAAYKSLWTITSSVSPSSPKSRFVWALHHLWMNVRSVLSQEQRRLSANAQEDSARPPAACGSRAPETSEPSSSSPSAPCQTRTRSRAACAI